MLKKHDSFFTSHIILSLPLGIIMKWILKNLEVLFLIVLLYFAILQFRLSHDWIAKCNVTLNNPLINVSCQLWNLGALMQKSPTQIIGYRVIHWHNIFYFMKKICYSNVFCPLAGKFVFIGLDLNVKKTTLSSKCRSNETSLSFELGKAYLSIQRVIYEWMNDKRVDWHFGTHLLALTDG